MSVNPKWKWNKEQFIKDCMNMVINRWELENDNISKNYFTTDDEIFVEKEYQEIIRKVFNLFDAYKNKSDIVEDFINKVNASRIIVFAQYFGGAPTLEVARMISYTNMITYIGTALGKDICGHRIGYGLMDRLQYLFRFNIYEKDVFLNCMAKIALTSLQDHYEDQEEDKIKCKFNNPFLTEEINESMFLEYKKGLVDIIEKGL